MFTRIPEAKIPELRNLGLIQFNSDIYALRLLVAILQNVSAANDYVLKVGMHTLEVTANEGKRTITFNLNRSCHYRGVMDMKNPDLYQTELFKLVNRDAKIFGYLKAGAHLAARDQKDSRNCDELYFLPYHVMHRIVHGIDYYDVFAADDLKVGSGAFGKVYSPIGTVKPAFSVIGKMIYSPGREKRVVKQLNRISQYEVNKSIFYYQCEMNTMQQVGLFDIRDAAYLDEDTLKIVPVDSVQDVYRSKGFQSLLLFPFFSMRYFHGLKMETLFDSDAPQKKPKPFIRDNKSALFNPTSLFQQSFMVHLHSLPTLLSIIDGFLHALIYDYGMNGVIHGDLKIDHLDVMVDPVSFGMWVKILDHGLSFHVEEIPRMGKFRKDSSPGTPLYMSLNMLNGHLCTMADDWYAAAVCIGLLLGDAYMGTFNSFQQFKVTKSNANHIDFILGRGCPLPAPLLPQLSEILFGMTKQTENNRMLHQDAVFKFREVALDYYLLQTKDEAEKVIIRDHFAMGCRLRAKLDKLGILQAAPTYFGALKESLSSAVSSVEDIPLAIAAFTQVMNVARLMNCKTKNALIRRIEDGFHQYEQAIIALQAAKDRLKQIYWGKQIPETKMHELSAYLGYAERADAKHYRYRCRFEHMLLITTNVQEKAAKLNRAILYFTAVKPNVDTHHSREEKSIDPFQNRLRF